MITFKTMKIIITHLQKSEQTWSGVMTMFLIMYATDEEISKIIQMTYVKYPIFSNTLKQMM